MFALCWLSDTKYWVWVRFSLIDLFSDFTKIEHIKKSWPDIECFVFCASVNNSCWMYFSSVHMLIIWNMVYIACCVDVVLKSAGDAYSLSLMFLFTGIWKTCWRDSAHLCPISWELLRFVDCQVQILVVKAPSLCVSKDAFGWRHDCFW